MSVTRHLWVVAGTFDGRCLRKRWRWLPVRCGGKLDWLRVAPARSSKYINDIVMCRRCKRFWP